MKKLLVMISIVAFLVLACVPQQATKEVPAVPEPQNITPAPAPIEAPKPPAVQQEPIVKLNKTVNNIYNDQKGTKFEWGSGAKTYTIELISVSSDNQLCNIKINGKSGFYELSKPVDFGPDLRVEVMSAVVTHGFTGDSCKVSLYDPS